jgi:hypothetical protein
VVGAVADDRLFLAPRKKTGMKGRVERFLPAVLTP